MAKKLKLDIKNTQIAKAINLKGLKDKLAQKKASTEEEKPEKKSKAPTAQAEPVEETSEKKSKAPTAQTESAKAIEPVETVEEPIAETPAIKARTRSAFAKEKKEPAPKAPPPPKEKKKEEPLPQQEEAKEEPVEEKAPPVVEKLGPTGRHINDILPPKKPKKEEPPPKEAPQPQAAAKEAPPKGPPQEDEGAKKKKKPSFKEFRDLKPAKKQASSRSFDARDRKGLRDTEEGRWRKRRQQRGSYKTQEELAADRPSNIKVRIPITIKDLAAEMKLKASELIGNLFKQGMITNINTSLDDETTIQLLGQEFECEVEIDTSEEERIRITGKTIKEEITATDPTKLSLRPPVVAFMGHVDHGKTSLIDKIRKSSIATGEAGAITQHIGAFRCTTPVGDITILDTPGHEAFSAMRARGADLTDIVVLVVAGDEGIRQQTVEAIQHARAAKVTIIVAINKCDKPNFDADNVYRQLSENELLPESWGGQTITVNCSAVTGVGIDALLEMLALQAEVLELRVDRDARARGTVIESEMHKGLGTVATILIQNGTLRLGDAVVFDQHWARVKTMHDEFGKNVLEADPSSAVEITGLSGLPEAGYEFIVVENEKEAREISEARFEGEKLRGQQIKQAASLDKLLQDATAKGKKVLNVVLRADVQGSAEAMKNALLKIVSEKAEVNVIFTGVGEVSESDVQLAAASKAMILGFHTQVESHAEALVKEMGVTVRMHDVIYHAVDDIREALTGLLDKLAKETETGKAEVIATFKSSHYGVIAGCRITSGTIHRNHYIRIHRGGEVIWKGTLSSIRREKEDVREVTKGLECGIVLNGFNDAQEGDELEAFEVTYISQKL